MPPTSTTTKHIFVTGGVASSLGKGLTASSLGMLLKARGLRVTMQKLDPYLNVDPGTMNPFQHGEVFVTNDGAETDLDIGHYERFLDVDLDGSANVTTGQVYSTVIAKERRGEYLGDTVQVIPHITNEIKHRIRRMATDDVDVVITEVGGTVGDIESLPFLETVRQVRHEVGRDNVFVVHISLLPYIGPSGELKTKPTQHSVAALRNIGIQPDAIVLRCRPRGADRDQAQDLADVRRRRGRRGRLPRRPVDLRHPQGAAHRGPGRLRRPQARPAVPRRGLDRLGRPAGPGPQPGPRGHRRAGRQVHRPARRLPVGDRGDPGGRLRQQGPGQDQVGHLRRLQDSGGRGSGSSADVDGVCIPGGFGDRGVLGKVGAIKYARENRMPLLGLCLGLQCIVIEAARNLAGIADANSTEFDPATGAPGDLHHGGAARHRRR